MPKLIKGLQIVWSDEGTANMSWRSENHNATGRNSANKEVASITMDEFYGANPSNFIIPSKAWAWNRFWEMQGKGKSHQKRWKESEAAFFLYYLLYFIAPPHQSTWSYMV